jgi:hypothetical protein
MHLSSSRIDLMQAVSVSDLPTVSRSVCLEMPHTSRRNVLSTLSCQFISSSRFSPEILPSH